MVRCSCLYLKTALAALLILILGATSGCFGRKEKKTPANPPPAFTVRPAGNTNVVMTPAASPMGRIMSVNTEGNFAVIGFPLGQLPANGKVFSVYRSGMKTGQLRISGPAQESFTVGDFISGSGQEGDEVRAE